MRPTPAQAWRLNLSMNALHRICNHLGVCAHLSKEYKIENTVEHVTEFLNNSPKLQSSRLLDVEDVAYIITHFANDRFTIKDNLVVRHGDKQNAIA